MLAMPAGLTIEEEQWREPLDRLCERFPAAGVDRAVDALRQHGGHAGRAGAYLRELLSAAVKEPDPEDAQHVTTLLESPLMFKKSCREHFEQYDVDGNGSLDLEEIAQLAASLCASFGLEMPSEGSVRAFFAAMDENGDGVVSKTEFRVFFEKFLRLAYFDVTELRRIVEEGEAKAVSSSNSTKENLSPENRQCHDKFRLDKAVLA